MNRPKDRRYNLDHPHNHMLQRRGDRLLQRLMRRHEEKCRSAPPPMTREQYEAIQATLPEADRIPW